MVNERDVAALDDLITQIRTLAVRSEYRRRVLGDQEGRGIAVLRTLRAVELLSQEVGRPSVRQVAERLQLEHSTASRHVDRAVELGLAEKKSCAEDGRVVKVELSAAGRDVVERSTARRLLVLQRVLEGWESADVSTMVDLLGRLMADSGREIGLVGAVGAAESDVK